MKLCMLLAGEKDVRSGFVNLDPLAPPDDPYRTRFDWTNLDSLCSPAEATEIVAQDILDVLPRAEAYRTLEHWLTRLGHGGTLTLIVLDAVAVARALACGEISPEDAGKLLYGTQEQPWQVRKSEWYAPQLAEWFRNRGLEVIKQRVQYCRAVLVVRRP